MDTLLFLTYRFVVSAFNVALFPLFPGPFIVSVPSFRLALKPSPSTIFVCSSNLFLLLLGQMCILAILFKHKVPHTPFTTGSTGILDFFL